MKREKIFRYFSSDCGSLSLLSTSLFLLLVVCSFLTLNVASEYLAKRELVQIGELTLMQSVHTLNRDAYYHGTAADFSTTNGITSDSGNSSNLLPIDCSKAQEIFMNNIALLELRGSPIATNHWDCDGFVVSARLVSTIRSLLKIPLIENQTSNPIDVSISATNRLS